MHVLLGSILLLKLLPPSFTLSLPLNLISVTLFSLKFPLQTSLNSNVYKTLLSELFSTFHHALISLIAFKTYTGSLLTNGSTLNFLPSLSNASIALHLLLWQLRSIYPAHWICCWTPLGFTLLPLLEKKLSPTLLPDAGMPFLDL